jgi:hypothetical protein
MLHSLSVFLPVLDMGTGTGNSCSCAVSKCILTFLGTNICLSYNFNSVQGSLHM